MKKIIALFLALLLVFALFGCKPKENTPDTPSTPADTGTSSETPPSDSGTIDRNERDPYSILYMCSSLAIMWCKNIETSLLSMEEEYNFKLISADTNRDGDKYISNIETYADQGVDGMLLNADATIAQRAYEVSAEYGVPVVFESTAMRADDGALLTSGVELNAYDVGVTCANWLIDNYKTYWGEEELDQSTLGILIMTYSPVDSFVLRSNGAHDTLAAAFPDANMFIGDLAAQGASNAEAAYNEAAPIVSAHPEIKHWLFSAALDDYGLGANRALEDNNLGTCDISLGATVGGEVLLSQWEEGYDEDGKGSWKACAYFEAYDYAEILLPGMIKHLDEGTPIDQLWPDHREAGSDSTHASIKISGTPCMKADYKALVKMWY